MINMIIIMINKYKLQQNIKKNINFKPKTNESIH